MSGKFGLTKRKRGIVMLFSLSLVITLSFPTISQSIGGAVSESLVVAQTVPAKSDQQEVRRLILEQEAKLRSVSLPQVAEIVDLSVKIVKNYAYVTVSDKYTGGVSLLKKEQGQWKIVSGSGGAYRAQDLVQLGVPVDIARKLIRNTAPLPKVPSHSR